MLLVALLATACGSTTATDTDCQPGDNVIGGLGPSGDPDRRIEDIEFVLTGLRQFTDEDGDIGEMTEDPNFGGVWGDFKGGIIVAVTDCSKVDADELARIAGGADKLTVVEVSHTYRQVNGYRDALAIELRQNGIAADLPINSTTSGRFIEVQVLNRDDLPENFGATVPRDLYTVVEVDRVAPKGSRSAPGVPDALLDLFHTEVFGVLADDP